MMPAKIKRNCIFDSLAVVSLLLNTFRFSEFYAEQCSTVDPKYFERIGHFRYFSDYFEHVFIYSAKPGGKH